MDYMRQADFDAHRDEIKRQTSAILAARSSELGRRAVRIEVFSYETGTRLADVVASSFGLVVVTYEAADTGEVKDLAPLTDSDEEREFDLAHPFDPVPSWQLRRSIDKGRKKITISRDIEGWADRRLIGYRKDASPLARATSRRNRLRNLIKQKRELGVYARHNEVDLLHAEAEVERLRRKTRERDT
jgi:hypothetical protein